MDSLFIVRRDTIGPLRFIYRKTFALSQPSATLLRATPTKYWKFFSKRHKVKG
jgi:hypothetical protein